MPIEEGQIVDKGVDCLSKLTSPKKEVTLSELIEEIKDRIKNLETKIFQHHWTVDEKQKEQLDFVSSKLQNLKPVLHLFLRRKDNGVEYHSLNCWCRKSGALLNPHNREIVEQIWRPLIVTGEQV